MMNIADIAGELYDLKDYINMLADDLDDNNNDIADVACNTVLSIYNIICRLEKVKTELIKYYD